MKRFYLLSILTFSLFLLMSVVGTAHEVRPGYLEITENAPGQYIPVLCLQPFL